MKQSSSNESPSMTGGKATTKARRDRLFWGPLALFVLLGTSVVVVWRTYRAEEQRAHEQEVSLLADQLARRLEEFIQVRLSLLGVVRDARLEGLMPDVGSFQAQTEYLEAEFGGFHAINWIDPQGVIRWISPEERNREALGRNVFEHAKAGPFLRAAESSGEPRMTSPLDLFQGGRAFTAYYPEVDGSEVLRGYVNGVFLIATLVEESLGEDVLGVYDVKIRDGAVRVYPAQEQPGRSSSAEPTAHAVLELLERVWSFELTPLSNSRAQLANSSHLSVLVGGLALAAAIAFALWLTLTRLDQERRSVQARLELEERLQASQKMEAIGQLAGGVAHDFNNILTAILGNADLASQCPELTGPYRAALGQVMVAGERAVALTKRLLSFSRQQVVKVERLHLNREVRELSPMLERLVRSDIRLHFDLVARNDMIEMDPGQVSQVVMNLVLNSVDAMPRGGDLRVCTRDVDEFVSLIVSDTGEGMDEATRSRVLEPFFTTKPVGKGTGLGLSTVYGEVTSAGGDVEIESIVGEGTTIEVRLPRVKEMEYDSTTDLPRSAGTRERVRVLLVEDEEVVLQFARHALETAGHEVHTAQDGEQALELLNTGADFEVVVTDAVMPRLGGVELIRRLRERGQVIGLVIMSGYSADLLGNSPTLADVHFLAKPFASRALVEVVEIACEPPSRGPH
jgi:signal transduction histidine kinase/CheY-like chemotaxis protein